MGRGTALALSAALTVLAACGLDTEIAAPDGSSPPTQPVAPDGASAAAAGLEEATVVRIIDGDTIEVRLADGRIERVRYIGIDTPETVAPGRPVEPWGPEATAANTALLGGGVVWLEKDVSEHDRFDRLLRYVYVPGADGDRLFVNEALVRRGLAQVATFPPDVKHTDRLLAAQKLARLEGLGIWAQQPTGEPTPAPSTETESATCDPSYPDVCIPPPPPDLDCGEISHRHFTVLPPDPHRFDGDRDGVGCES